MKKRLTIISLIVIIVISIVGLLIFSSLNKSNTNDVSNESIDKTKTNDVANDNKNVNEDEQIDQYDEPIDYLIFDEEDNNILDDESKKKPQYIPSDDKFHDPEEEPTEHIDEPATEEEKSVVEIDETGKMAIDLSDGNNKTEIIYE